ncbi:hypothetical protein HNR24_000358 [Nesterenkonia jeotgali]|uniref:Uncharacterized protein n=1 Tax=Nesterenkonia jeotgali TaxID=317018 RepID=A0A839FLW5_9MICC|nr:hypothetical protein [Nesterenkonia jeotgali]
MSAKVLRGSRNPVPFQDECLKPRCEKRVPEGYGFQLCERHLAKAWAAFQILLNEKQVTL